MGRVDPAGVAPRTPELIATWNGVPLAAAAGETIAAALLAAGEPACRVTRGGAARGPFCGMGVCHDCLVTVDGAPSRACLTLIAPGARVARHQVGAADAARPPVATEVRQVDLAVVGAGPAGLAAARAAALAGLKTLLIDERKQAGGQYLKQPAAAFAVDPTRLDAQFREGRTAIEAARVAGVDHLADATVWAADAEGALLVDAGDRAIRVEARRLLLATGAGERAVPFPGWTLPGVMTTGAAQSFLRATGVTPGRRVVIAGAGPLNLQLASELVALGVEVVALAETGGPPGPMRLGALAEMAASAPDLVRDGVRHLLRVVRAGTRLFYRATAVAAEGDGRLARVALAPIDRQGRPDRAALEWIAADALCIGHGFNPSVELAASLGCRLAIDPRWRHLAVATDGDGRTSHAWVFAAGDGAAFGGARVARAAGWIAGAAIAADLGRAVPGVATARLERERARRFQRALWRLHDGPVLTDQLAEADTPICRCEEVTLAAIERARAEGAGGAGAIKRATRLGMGRCQGRYCAPVLIARLAREGGRVPDPDEYFAPRTPIRPTRIATVAATDPGPM
jgi:NADPH-dependent 2,4-dienoyl-CoA reductase/sulfur reductase-like enzyme